MAWELTWPLALMDLAVVALIHGVLQDPGQTLDSIWAIAAFFVAAPWVVRRALGRSYGIWLIAVQRSTQRRGGLTYQESLRVMWLLAWRVLPLLLGALLAISGALRLAGVSTRALAAQGPLANALGLSAVDAVSSLMFYPLLIPGMLRKRFRGFHLELQAAPRPPVPRARRK